MSLRIQPKVLLKIGWLYKPLEDGQIANRKVLKEEERYLLKELFIVAEIIYSLSFVPSNITTPSAKIFKGIWHTTAYSKPSGHFHQTRTSWLFFTSSIDGVSKFAGIEKWEF